MRLLAGVRISMRLRLRLRVWVLGRLQLGRIFRTRMLLIGRLRIG